MLNTPLGMDIWHYKGQRYHLLDFRQTSGGNHLEKRFNYVHSSLRSVIERTLECGRIDGVFLKQMPSYDIKNLCGSFFGQYLGPSRNKDSGPFTCC